MEAKCVQWIALKSSILGLFLWAWVNLFACYGRAKMCLSVLNKAILMIIRFVLMENLFTQSLKGKECSEESAYREGG